MIGFLPICQLPSLRIRLCKQVNSRIETTMTVPQLRCNGATFKFRRYHDATDRDQVKRICANLYNSQDYVPRLLPAYASSSRCEPYVLEGPTGVAAFIVARHRQVLADHNAPFYKEIFIEALRVREDLQGVGVATNILIEATNAVRCALGKQPDLHIFSTTIPENKAMTQVFRKAGWKPLSNMIIWPKEDEIRSLQNTGRSMLESLDMAHKISPNAIALASKWRKINDSEDICSLVDQLRGNSSQFLRPGYFVAEGLPSAALFLKDELSKREERSAWRLDCDQRLLGLLFIRPHVLERSSNAPPNIVSACVDDTYSAESAVVFAGNLLKKASFQVSFDVGINAEKMESSLLLSSLKATHFIVYKHSK